MKKIKIIAIRLLLFLPYLLFSILLAIWKIFDVQGYNEIIKKPSNKQ
jgi:hypothetical protein